MAKRLAFATAVAVVVAAVATPTFGQEVDRSVPACELSGGYGFLHDYDLEENLPAGWYFSAAGNINRWFGLVGEIAGSHKTFDDALPFASVKGTVLTGLGGPRVFRKFGRFVPYGQVLAGAAHIRTSMSSPLAGRESDNETYFALQPGGGLLLYVNNRIGAQVSADYRWIRPNDGASDEGLDEFRFLTGVVVGFGSR